MFLKNKCLLLGTYLKELKAETRMDTGLQIHDSSNHKAKSFMGTT